jgi:hypothetical protein
MGTVRVNVPLPGRLVKQFSRGKAVGISMQKRADNPVTPYGQFKFLVILFSHLNLLF